MVVTLLGLCHSFLMASQQWGCSWGRIEEDAMCNISQHPYAPGAWCLFLCAHSRPITVPQVP